MLRYIVGNPCADFFSAIMCAALNLNFRRTYILLKAGITSLADGSALFLEAKMLKKHGGRENLGQRIGNILSGSLRP